MKVKLPPQGELERAAKIFIESQIDSPEFIKAKKELVNHIVKKMAKSLDKPNYDT